MIIWAGSWLMAPMIIPMIISEDKINNCSYFIKGKIIQNFKWFIHSNLYGKKQQGTKEPLDEGERGEWKPLKLNIQETKIMLSSPITS